MGGGELSRQHAPEREIWYGADNSAGVDPLPAPQRHAGRAVAFKLDSGDFGVQSNLAASVFDKALRLPRVKIAQPHTRNDHRRIALRPHKSEFDHSREHIGGSDLRRLIQSRQRHWPPEPALNALGLAQTVEPFPNGDLRELILIAIERPHRQSHAQRPQTVSPADGLQSRQSAEQMQRRGQRRTFEARAGYRAVGSFMKEVHLRVGLKFEFVERADLLKKPERPMITAHHQMLSVINRVAGDLIGERIGPAAKKRTAFKQQGSRSRLSQIDGGGEAGKAAPDNQDNGSSGLLHSELISLSRRPLVPLSPCPPVPLSPTPAGAPSPSPIH